MGAAKRFRTLAVNWNVARSAKGGVCHIRNKLARGKFTAVFLIQCLEAIGASSLRLSDG